MRESTFLSLRNIKIENMALGQVTLLSMIYCPTKQHLWEARLLKRNVFKTWLGLDLVTKIVCFIKCLMRRVSGRKQGW